MEKWQEQHIRKHFCKLIELTTCNASLLTHLALFLGKDDEALLETSLKSEGKLAQGRLFYDIAIKKLGMYEALINALFETKQTGAFQILLDGIMKHRVNGVLGISEFNPQQLQASLIGFERNALQCVVEFQGCKIQLQNVFENLQTDLTENLIKKYLKDNLLLQLIDNKRPVLVNNTIPDHLRLGYYISRRLTTRAHLDFNLIDEGCKDVFVVENIHLDKLSTAANGKVTDISSNQTESLTANFIVLEYEQDYHTICKISTQPVHLLNHNNGKFVWLKTYGDISSLQASIIDTPDKMKEENFLQSCLQRSHPICISDTPGMGKSVLLASIANKIMQNDSKRLVQFIVLREFVQQVEEKGNGMIDTELLISLISQQASDLELGQELVRILLQSESLVVELMFDGFDEVLLSQVEMAKKILHKIAKLKSVRLYVATRPHMRDELERTIGVLGYNIEAFGVDEQVECLQKYWMQQGASNSSQLTEFARRCLETLSKNMKNSERDIAGIPLQCRILAEVYQKDAIKYSKPETRKSEIDFGMVINIRSIFDMYQRLVDMRFQKISTTNRKNDLLKKKQLSFAHMYAALQLLFPELVDRLKTIVKEDCQVKSQELWDLGILEKKKSVDSMTPRFIHRTFAEYFVGLFVVKVLLQHDDYTRQILEGETLVDFFFNTILITAVSWETPLSYCRIGKCNPIRSATFINSVICYFINAHLKHNRLLRPKHKLPWTRDATKLYNVIAACIVHDYPTLFLQISENPETSQKLILKHCNMAHLTILSAMHSSLELFTVVHTQLLTYCNGEPQFVDSSSPEFTVTPLHVALERGYFALCNYLLNLKSYYKVQLLKYLVHCCVAGSMKDNQTTVSLKLGLVGMLAHKSKDLINETMPDGTPPHLQSEVHVKILAELLKFGADINAVNSYGCVLHKYSESEISAESFHKLVLSLLDYDFNQFNSVDYRQRSPLHVALQRIELLENTIQLFHYVEAHFNAVDEKGDSVLFYAIRSNRSAGLINRLVYYGASIKHKNLNMDNVFHICAKYGNLLAFENFLRSKDFDLTILCAFNKNNITPFIQAMSYGKGLTIQIIELMELKGFVVNTDLASDGLKGLLCNRNLMAWELGSEFVKVADFLLEAGGVVSCRKAVNLWELEASKKNMQSIRLSIQFNENLTTQLAKRGVGEIKTGVRENQSYHYNESVLSELDKRGRLRKGTKIFEAQPDVLFNSIESSSRTSFERLCISLIACDQIKPFLLLKQCVQSDAQESVKFVTSTKGLVEFVESKQELVIFIISWNYDLTTTRIKNLFDAEALVIRQKAVNTKLSESNLTIIHCDSLTEDLHQAIDALKRKIVCLCRHNETNSLQKAYRVLCDDFSWDDLSIEFQNKLTEITPLQRVCQEAIDYPNEDYLKLQNESLVNFIEIKENLPSYVVKVLDQYTHEYLNKSKLFVTTDLPEQFVVTPLHVAVKRGHLVITKYCLDEMTLTALLEIKYIIHGCIAGSVEDSDAIIENKKIIIKILSKNSKHWFNERLPDGTTPLLQPKIHWKLFECVVNLGADVSTENNNGTSILLKSISSLKGLSVRLIKLMEDRGLCISERLASQALQVWITTGNIAAQNLDLEFVHVVDYLMSLGGKLKLRIGMTPWKLEAVERNIPLIIEATHCDENLLAELEMQGLILSKKDETFLGQPQSLYDKLQSSPYPAVFEKLCASLVFCNQIHPFILLLQSVKSTIGGSALFLTPPNGLFELIDSQNHNVVVLLSLDLELTIARIKDIVDTVVIINNKKDINASLPIADLIIYECKIATTEEVEFLTTLGQNVICVCSDIGCDLQKYKCYQEEIVWEDLSKKLRDDLFDSKDDKVPKEISDLRNAELVKFIRNNLPQFIGYDINESQNHGDYLSSDIFHYFLSDKLVFNGTTLNELEQFVKFGHKIGKLGDDIRKVDYVVVEDTQQFDEICKQTTSTVHLIIYRDKIFQLVETRGSDKNIKNFISRKPTKQHCDDFPVCTCGNHKVGSENLIWNIFRYPGSEQTCWVNILNLFELTRTKDSFRITDPSVITSITQVFNAMFISKTSLECWRQISEKIGCSFIANEPIHLLDVIEELFKYVGCNENERVQLQKVAAKTLFPKFVKKFEVPTCLLDKYVKIGILKYDGKSVVFFHKVLVWYFVTKMLLIEIEQPSQLVTELRQEILRDCFESIDVEVNIRENTAWNNWVGKNIKTFRFVETTFFRFLDRLVSLNPNFVSTWLDLGVTNAFQMKWLNACILGNHYHLLNIFVSFGIEQSIFKSEDLVTLAVMYADVRIIEVVTEKFQHSTSKQIFDIQLKYEDILSDIYITILHVASSRGNYSVMEYLLNSKGFKHNLNQQMMRNILDFCLYNTQKYPEQVTNRKRIVKLVLENDDTWINQKSDTWISPFVFKNVHVDLIIYLINLGVIVTAANPHTKYIMHKCAEYMTPKEYHKLLEALHIGENSKIFHTRDEWMSTPLHFAVRYLEVIDSSLQLFSSANADFNAKDDNGNTVLIWAVRYKRSLRLLEALINYGAEFCQLGQHNSTVLHVASEHGNLGALKYFILRGCDVNAKNESDNTPLHLAFNYYNDHIHDMVQILVEHGADVNVINTDKHTPLSLALQRKDKVEDRTVQFLRNGGAHE